MERFNFDTRCDECMKYRAASDLVMIASSGASSLVICQGCLKDALTLLGDGRCIHSWKEIERKDNGEYAGFGAHRVCKVCGKKQNLKSEWVDE